MGCADKGRSACLEELEADAVIRAAEGVLGAVPRTPNGGPSDHFRPGNSPLSQ
jgi:hypothetical protein